MDKRFKTALITAISQAPVVGVTVKFWKPILETPVVAIAVFLAYEGLLLFWKEIGSPIWQQVWVDNYKDQTVKKISRWLLISISHLFTGVRKRYLQHVVHRHRVFPVRGLLTPHQGILKVQDVFVEPWIAPSHAYQVSSSPIAQKTLSGSKTAWAFIRGIKRQDATALAILGPPGCGKTSLLKNIALNMSEKNQASLIKRFFWFIGAAKHPTRGLPAYLPIFLYLREHAKTIADENPSLPELAQQHFSDAKQYENLDPPPSWFASQIIRGNCLVLLDGLDEVDTHCRQITAQWVDRQIRTYPATRFIITARPHGYRDSQLRRAYILEILPFTTDQVKTFVHNWYLANKIIRFGQDDVGIRKDAQNDAENLLARLEERDQLKVLTINPLLLTMITNVHNFRGELPKRRVELYKEITDVLLVHWQSAKGVTDLLTGDQKRVVLEPLAENMMKRKVREIDFQDAMKVISPYLEQVGISETDQKAFLESVQSGSGLMLEQKTGEWMFAHLTFQEYLCACHWIRSGDHSAWEKAHWRPFVSDGWWHETLRLYAAQADATVLAKACIEDAQPLSLKLAEQITVEALKIDPEIRENVKLSVASRVEVVLRREPVVVSEKEFIKTFNLDEKWRPLQYIENKYHDNHDGTVTDHATGLMWEKSGSPGTLKYENALEYVKKLNQDKFAQHDDWRLPTVDELASLLEPEMKNKDLYIDPVFDHKQRWCWTSDKKDSLSGPAWVFNFNFGRVSWIHLVHDLSFVRSVRSRQ